MMKKIFFTLMMLMMSITISAQQDAFRKAVARYQKTTSVMASVVKTTHRKAVATDQVDKGVLTMKKPSEVSIVIDGGKDQLLMQGSNFTMVVKGKKHTTSSERNPQFTSFQTVFESILSGGAKDISLLKDLSLTQKGRTLVLTISPVAEGKAAKRMLFSSFVLTIDSQTSELKSLRMNERAGYTEYVFTNFQFK